MLRLTGGEFRGRSIRTPRESERTRPSQAKLRQALFNSLQAYIPGARVLDLFAGPGTLGFEALSRGAEKVVFVESARSVSKLISDNARELGVLDRVVVHGEEVERIWSRLGEEGPFDLVLADPPYAGGFEDLLLQKAPWERLLAPDGHFCLEWGTVKSQVTELPDTAAGGILVKVREKNYGDSVLTTFRRHASLGILG
jgi:16S rRNA (guanine966-N2)-methyltransferase